jgi:two-component system OmpR family sensor kinase
VKFFSNIRAKLTLAFTGIFGATLIIFSVILYGIFANQSRDEVDKVLSVLASSVSETIKATGIKEGLLAEIKTMNIPFTYANREYIQIVNSSGKIILRSDQLINDSLPVSKEIASDVMKGKTVYRTLAIPANDNLWDEAGIRLIYHPASHKKEKYIVVVGVSLSNLENQLAELRWIFYAAIPLTLLFSAVVGWLFSSRAYNPVKQLIQTSESITAQNLSSRLPVNPSGDEIAQLAETLNKMIERLENSFKVMRQFTSDASHELKTPLTILRGEIEVTLQKLRTQQEYESVLRDSLEEVTRLQSIVEGLLTLSKLEAEGIILQKDRVNLNEIVTDAVSRMSAVAANKQIKIVLNLSPPPSSPPKQDDTASISEISVNGDQAKLTNVIINLLDNAIKYSVSGSEVVCTIAANSHNALVAIRDSGPGIPESELDKIFQRFYRVDSSRTRGDSFSLGLGLSIAKAVVESHGGKITVRSKVGQGSEFTISLPRT